MGRERRAVRLLASEWKPGHVVDFVVLREVQHARAIAARVAGRSNSRVHVREAERNRKADDARTMRFVVKF